VIYWCKFSVIEEGNYHWISFLSGSLLINLSASFLPILTQPHISFNYFGIPLFLHKCSSNFLIESFGLGRSTPTRRSPPSKVSCHQSIVPLFSWNLSIPSLTVHWIIITIIIRLWKFNVIYPNLQYDLGFWADVKRSHELWIALFPLVSMDGKYEWNMTCQCCRARELDQSHINSPFFRRFHCWLLSWGCSMWFNISFSLRT
jgi:hypothetical protein